MRPALAVARRTLVAAALAACLAGCDDRPTDPAGPRTGTSLHIRLQASVSGGMAEAYARLDSAHVTITQGAATLLDTLAAFGGTAGGGLALAVPLPEPTGTITVALELRARGLVLFRGGGSAQLQRGATVSVPITVAPVVGGVTAPDSVTLTALGDTLRLRGAVIFPTGDTLNGPAVTWSSAGGSAISVSTDGLVTALGDGQASAIASYQSFSHTTSVRVAPVVTRVDVSPTALSLYVDSTQVLAAIACDRNGHVLDRTLTWSTSNAAVATVDGNGLVKAVAPGTATITASAEGKSAGAAITVRRVPVGAVRLTPDSVELVVGSTVRLKATTLDITGKLVTDRAVAWSTDNAAVAAVDTAGLVEALQVGAATITATSEGRSGQAAIRVVQPSVGVSVPRITFTTLPGSGLYTQSVSITNAGTGTLNGLSVAVAFGQPSATGWLTAALSRDVAPAILSLTADPSAVPPGTYTATVSVTSTVPGSGSVQIPVTLTVQQPVLWVSRNAVSLRTGWRSGGTVADTVTVLNAGTGLLANVVGSVSYAANEPTGWLTVTPTTWASLPTGRAVMSLTATDSVPGATSALAPGTYHATVTLSSAVAGAGTVQVSVLLYVQTAPTTDVTYSVLHSSVRFWNVAVAAVSAGTIAGNTAIVPPGATIRLTGSWQMGAVTDTSYCPYCIIQIYVAWIGPAAVSATPINLGLWQGIIYPLNPQLGPSGTFDFTTTAPTAPGEYYLGKGESWDYLFQPWIQGSPGYVTGGSTATPAVSFRIRVQ